MAMDQSGEQPVFSQENYVILFGKIPYATRDNTERKPEVWERPRLLENSRWEQDIVDGCDKPKLKTTSHY
jgi:hypothetical protein